MQSVSFGAFELWWLGMCLQLTRGNSPELSNLYIELRWKRRETNFLVKLVWENFSFLTFSRKINLQMSLYFIWPKWRGGRIQNIVFYFPISNPFVFACINITTSHEVEFSYKGVAYGMYLFAWVQYIQLVVAYYILRSEQNKVTINWRFAIWLFSSSFASNL